MDINSGAFWESLGYEERRIAVQAITEWREKVEFRKKIEELKKEIFDKMEAFHRIADWQDMDDLMEELTNTYN